MSLWSNFFIQQDEESRIGVAGTGQGGGVGGPSGMKGGRAPRRMQRMSDSQEGKIKLAFLVAIIGMTLTVLGMGTEFWVELAQPKHFSGNQTCQMAHYGLWKGCIRTLWVADIDPERTSCGPAELPGGESSGWCEPVLQTVLLCLFVECFPVTQVSLYVSPFALCSSDENERPEKGQKMVLIGWSIEEKWCVFPIPTEVKTEGWGITNMLYAHWECAYICRSFIWAQEGLGKATVPP